jgi:hypothetical protein
VTGPLRLMVVKQPQRSNMDLEVDPLPICPEGNVRKLDRERPRSI